MIMIMISRTLVMHFKMCGIQSSNVREINSRKQECLDKLRPENIVKHWEKLIYDIV